MAPKAQTGKSELSIHEILFFAPEVAAVIRRARYVRRGNERAYCRFKAEISIYVGWWAEIKALRSSYAYELCIAALVGAMGTGPRRRRAPRARKAPK